MMVFVFVINGLFDLQVDVEQNFLEIEKVLCVVGNDDVIVEMFDSLNYFFQMVCIGSFVEYLQIEEIFVFVVFECVLVWIVECFGIQQLQSVFESVFFGVFNEWFLFFIG